MEAAWRLSTMDVYRKLQKLWSDWIAPRCCLCAAAGSGDRELCSTCFDQLPETDHSCQICAEPIGAPATVCGRCQQRLPYFDRVYAGYRYAQPVDYFVTQLKYGRKPAYARLLAQLLTTRLIAEKCPMPQALVPVPLHSRRLVERGFNQAELMASELSRQFDVSALRSGVWRGRATTSQTSLSADARRKNMSDAFVIDSKRPIPAHVAVVDDVLTTGTTASELAKVLKRHGAERVDIWVAARA